MYSGMVHVAMCRAKLIWPYYKRGERKSSASASIEKSQNHEINTTWAQLHSFGMLTHRKQPSLTQIRMLSAWISNQHGEILFCLLELKDDFCPPQIMRVRIIYFSGLTGIHANRKALLRQVWMPFCSPDWPHTLYEMHFFPHLAACLGILKRKAGEPNGTS